MRMKSFIFGLFCFTAVAAVAQPPARRAAAQQQKEQTQQTSAAQYRDFPTAQPMPDDAAWRRDIYRTIDLTRDENATLYYPTVPQGDRMNLFTALFKMVLRKQIKAYDYKLDGNEDFSDKNVVTGNELMDRYHIFYEKSGDRVRVNDADIPSEEVKTFYIKESSYYDQHTSSFHTRVVALCPVLTRGNDDFGGDLDTRYPMFWVKYDDVAPYLAKLMLMGSNLNNAATLSADDYFTMNLYKGDIYKTTNLQDRVLQNYCTTDTALRKERSRIEKELADFQRELWRGDSVPVVVDTLAVKEKSSKQTSRRKVQSGRRASTSSQPAAATQKRQRSTSTKSSKPKSSGATYSVRRQRH